MRTKLYTSQRLELTPAFHRAAPVIVEPDPVLDLNRKAVEAIWGLWQIANRSSHAANGKRKVQAELAQRCLNGLVAYARDPGRTKRRPGDSATAEENRGMLNAFAMLANGKSMKETAIELRPDVNHENTIRSYGVLLKRFSIHLYDAVRAKYPRWGDVSLSSLSGTDIADTVENWPGVTKADAPALRKAFEFYFSKHAKLTKDQRDEADAQKLIDRLKLSNAKAK